MADGAGHVDLGHDPAAEHIAILVEVGRHRYDAQGGVLLGKRQEGRLHVSSKSKRCRDFPVKQPVFIYSGHPNKFRPARSMRRSTALPKPPAGQPLGQTHAWLTLRTLFPYLWRYRLRVLAALGCLIGAKVANVGVPMIFKEMIDGLSVQQQTLALPILLLALYGILRFSTSLFTELREILFARVTQRAVRQASLEVFRHLHALSLRFHLDRQTGGVSRDIERAAARSPA
jgi:hypothetical protein